MTQKPNSWEQWSAEMIAAVKGIQNSVDVSFEPSAQLKVFGTLSDLFAGVFTWVLVIPAAVIDGFRRAWSDMLEYCED